MFEQLTEEIARATGHCYHITLDVLDDESLARSSTSFAILTTRSKWPCSRRGFNQDGVFNHTQAKAEIDQRR